jgi:hypothetical protein
MTVYHAIERTSPKGPGSPFIGTCRLCGTPNLPMSAARQECPNQRGLTADESVVEAIALPAAASGSGLPPIDETLHTPEMVAALQKPALVLDDGEQPPAPDKSSTDQAEIQDRKE